MAQNEKHNTIWPGTVDYDKVMTLFHSDGQSKPAHPKVPERRAPEVPTRHLYEPPNLLPRQKTSFQSKTTGSTKSSTDLVVNYKKFMKLDQAELATMAYDNTRECNFVAIKKFKPADKRTVADIRPFQNNNVVGIVHAYFENDEIIVLYEPMVITLRRMTAVIPSGLKEHQIAKISKELTLGLEYIHDELRVGYGGLSCGKVLLNLEGTLKIANVGESFIHPQSSLENSRTVKEDICSIGYAMMELMEPETYALNDHTANLKVPGKWSKVARDFMRSTQNRSIGDLKTMPFLPQEPLGKEFKPYVFAAVFAASNDWDILDSAWNSNST